MHAKAAKLRSNEKGADAALVSRGSPESGTASVSELSANGFAPRAETGCAVAPNALEPLSLSIELGFTAAHWLEESPKRSSKEGPVEETEGKVVERAVTLGAVVVEGVACGASSSLRSGGSPNGLNAATGARDTAACTGGVASVGLGLGRMEGLLEKGEAL